MPGHKTEDARRLWLTAPAVGALPPRPVLMLSCVDDISRVELTLPKAIDIGSLQVVLEADGRRLLSQRWLSDDSGHILRSGRGLPAIAVMQAMLRTGDLRLRANDEAIDGLRFDARGLSEQIAPLRRQCGW
ncbi:Type VI secretion protein VasI [Marinobacterium lacunae]|uniref:Type VI secretion protein VasI n=2 Tax=Marinobacterium lacunae TaxID=1232683 RepID=A0A081G3B0_9GAMM|nr:Type VI secretion protein VasI [Marinobacterium lacunae]